MTKYYLKVTRPNGTNFIHSVQFDSKKSAEEMADFWGTRYPEFIHEIIQADYEN